MTEEDPSQRFMSQVTITEETLEPIKSIKAHLGIFEKYLSVWVLFCIASGVVLGHFIPSIPATLSKATISHISVPIAILVWGMILPMMLQIDFQALKWVYKTWKGVLLTSGMNYLIQPFAMYALSFLFFKHVYLKHNLISKEQADQYIAGSVILGGSPCTAMVFVWSYLMEGDAMYTLTQVIVNDLLILVAYVPTVQLLLGISRISIPWDTLIFSVVIFVLVPLFLGMLIRCVVQKRRGVVFLEEKVIQKLKPASMAFLCLTLILIFVFQAATMIRNPVHILLIAVILIIQTFLIWGLTYFIAYWIWLPFKVAGPASLIAASNFFELAVAVAISIFGADSGAVLVTTVGVLVEVPVMLILVCICNKTSFLFDKRVMRNIHDDKGRNALQIEEQN